ncbi:hypothetical protein SteCoe_26529 [Stentor coeruleus]|uniref:RING-type domain-containing protein n=1 Tax=Stentor coeruleus TaxID=5963 RepID=A0A1R2BCP5_9CILI|nr:hypothetical protein SteCoe_26529 [Stentor coeruleus]
MHFIFIYIRFSLACPLDNCETCLMNPFPMCINCLPGYKRDLLSGCLQILNSSTISHIENCIAYSTSSNCLKCSNEYNLLQGRCYPQCPKNCSCFYPNICLQYSRIIKDCQDQYCDSCHEETCLSCKNNYTLGINGNCLICEIENCNKCIKDNICIKCNNNYGLYDKSCVKCHDTNCRECNNNSEICEFCLNGYTLTENICEIGCLDVNCKQCSVSASICDTCADDYKFENGFCCPLNCKSCNNTKGTCYYCDNEYVLDQGSNKCVSCPDNCKTCSSSKKCEKCLSGFELDSNSRCKKNYTNSNLVSIIVPVIGGVVLFFCNSRCKKNYTNSNLVSIIVPVIGGVVLILIMCTIVYHVKKKSRFSQIGINKCINYQQVQNFEGFQNRDNSHINDRSSIAFNSAPSNEAPLQIVELDNVENVIPQVFYPPDIINYLTFTSVALVVPLDENLSYFGCRICKFCNRNFENDGDTRVLPCGHAYHGRCIYENMVVKNRKKCLYCNKKYN